MDPAMTVFWFWLLFAGTHTVFSHPPVRQALVARLSAGGYTLFYSFIALATFIPLVWVFFAHRAPGSIPLPVLAQSPGMEWATILLMFVATLLLVLGLSRPNPVSSLTGKSGSGATGVLRITRHPVFMGIALMGFAHLLVNNSAIDRVFFGGLLVYSVLGSAHQDWRRRQTSDPGREQFFAETAFLPFMAILQGKNQLVLREFSPLAAGLGIVGFGLFFIFHHRIVS